MENNYNSNDANNDFILRVFLIVLGLIFVPVFVAVPFFYKLAKSFRMKTTLIIAISIALLLISVVFANASIIDFIAEYIENSKVAAITIYENPTSIIKTFFNYIFSFSSRAWYLNLSISFAITSIFIYKDEEKAKKRAMGIMSLEEMQEEEKAKEQKVLTKKELKKLSTLEHSADSTVLGKNGNQTITIPDSAKHVLIAGTTGSGKTVTIANFFESALQKNYGLVAVDGKGDTDNGSMLHYLQELCDKYNRELVVVNLTDAQNSEKYNPFKDSSITEVKDMLMQMTDWTEPHYKVNTERYLQRLISMMKKASISISLVNIAKYSSNEFEKLSEQLESKKIITLSEHEKNVELIKATGAIADSALARYATTAESEEGQIFSENGIDIFTSLKENKVFLLVLDPLAKKELSGAVGRLAVIDAKKAISKIYKEENKKRSFFVFDEFNVYASESVVDLVNKSRSALVTSILAMQGLSDLDQAAGFNFRNQVLENCNNYIVMRQNTSTNAIEWEKTLGDYETFQMTFNIEKEYHSVFGEEKKNESSKQGSLSKVRKALYSAEQIQNQKTGQAIFMSRDSQKHSKINVRYISLTTKVKKRINIDEIKKEEGAEKVNLNKKDIPLSTKMSISDEEKEIKDMLIDDLENAKTEYNELVEREENGELETEGTEDFYNLQAELEKLEI